jgi:hypothetical protein
LGKHKTKKELLLDKVEPSDLNINGLEGQERKDKKRDLLVLRVAGEVDILSTNEAI